MSSDSVELITGYALAASSAALTKNGRNDRFTPSLAANPLLALARSAATRVTSTSITVVNCAAVYKPNFMFLAIDCRIRGSFCVVPISAVAASSGVGTLEPAAFAAAGAGAAAAAGAGGAAAAAAAALAASAAATTSSRRMRPPTPVPFTEDRSTPLSAASLRITGVT